MRLQLSVCRLWFLIIYLVPMSATAFPQDLSFEPAADSAFEFAVTLDIDREGRTFVGERNGRVWIVENGRRRAAPIIDISNEVAVWGAHGMSSLALSPRFLQDRMIFLFYVVDRNFWWCKEQKRCAYKGAKDSSRGATIARVTRFTLDLERNTVIPESRKVLIGTSPSDSIPIIDSAHGSGGLAFGEDKSLLVGVGDSATASGVDVGNDKRTSFLQAIEDGTLSERENVGNFRAQLLTSLNGKILRIDPADGSGLSDNPFFDAALPRSKQSRVWALGLRYPYRIRVRPGSQTAENPPGEILVGDVGWDDFDELNVVQNPAENFGWPLFEGIDKELNAQFGSVWDKMIKYSGALETCGVERPFSELLMKPGTSEEGALSTFPCRNRSNWRAQIYKLPTIEWSHSGRKEKLGERQASLENEKVITTTTAKISGNCSFAGAWYTGAGYPKRYRNTYFHVDFAQPWLRTYRFDSNYKILESEPLDDSRSILDVAVHPITKNLHYIALEGGATNIGKIVGNHRPVAKFVFRPEKFNDPDTEPLADLSEDPDGDPLTPQWREVESAVYGEEPEIELDVSDGIFGDKLRTLKSLGARKPHLTITTPSRAFVHSGRDTIVTLSAKLGRFDDTPPENIYWRVTRVIDERRVSSRLIRGNNVPVQIKGTPCHRRQKARFEIDASVVGAGGSQGVASTTVPMECRAKGVTIFFERPSSWRKTTPKIHFWEGENDDGKIVKVTRSEWPGVKMIYDGGQWFKYVFDDLQRVSFLIHDGDDGRDNRTAEFLVVKRDSWIAASNTNKLLTHDSRSPVIPVD